MIREEILEIFHKVRDEQRVSLRGDFAVSIATHYLKHLMKGKYTCAELRAELSVMPEIERDEYLSHRGNAVWRLKR